MEDWNRKLDVAKVPGTLLLAFAASGTHGVAVDGAQLGVVQALLARPMSLLVHGLGILDVTDTHVLDLLG